MKCRETNKLFTTYLDNEVTARERESMQAHLASCADCRREMETLSAIKAKLSQALKMVTDEASPADHAWAQLREKILNEKEAATARVLPARETWWERMGRVSLIPRRLTLRNATAGLLAIILIVTAVIALPILTRNDGKVSAAEIALDNTAVQNALNGVSPTKVEVTNNVDSAGTSRVVMTMPPDRVVVADVNIKKQTVTQIKIQSLADITPQQVIDIAKADTRVQNILKMGYNIYYGGVGEITITMFQGEEATEQLQAMGINNAQDLVGFSAGIMLKFNPGDYDGYLVWVNVSSGKVVGIADHPFTDFGTRTTTIVTKTTNKITR